MTDATFVAVAASVPPTITALAALIVSVRNGRKSDVIHVLVNSKMTQALSDLEDAKKEIIALRAEIET